MKGIQKTIPIPNRTVVKLLLASPEVEALSFVRRHFNNKPWLEMALDIESGKRKPCKSVVEAIKSNLSKA